MVGEVYNAPLWNPLTSVLLACPPPSHQLPTSTLCHHPPAKKTQRAPTRSFYDSSNKESDAIPHGMGTERFFIPDDEEPAVGSDPMRVSVQFYC